MSAVGRLRQVGDDATEGPWDQYGNNAVGSRGVNVALTFGSDRPADAEFIATARNVWDALLDVAQAADRVTWDHADTCGSMLTDAPCSCGVDELRAALDRLNGETP